MEVGIVGDTILFIELGKQDLYGVDLLVCEVLIRAEKVPQEGQVLGQQGSAPESVRRVGVVILLARQADPLVVRRFLTGDGRENDRPGTDA